MSGSSDCIVFLGKVPVADINRLEGWFFTLEYRDSWLGDPRAFPLSPCLPLDGNFGPDAVYAFFENMLPEGRALDILSQTNAISKKYVLDLAIALGSDLPGAVRLQKADSSEQSKSQIYRPIESAEIIQRLEQPDFFPMSVWDGRPRLSVAGVQTKINVLKRGATYGLADGPDIASNAILKFESPSQRHLLLNEHLCMEFAKSLGHPVAQTQLIRFGKHRALEVMRFDRRVTDHAVMRIHTIDGCQALGLPSDYKYERQFGDARDVAFIRDGANLKRLFGLSFLQNPIAAWDNLFDWVLYNLIIGNCDAHGKNYSFFGSTSGFRPAPWYDLVSVRMIPGVSHSLAMSVGDEFDPDAVHALQLLYLADDASLTKEFAAAHLNRILELAAPALDSLGRTIVDPDDEERAFVEGYKAYMRQSLAYWSEQARILPELSV